LSSNLGFTRFVTQVIDASDSGHDERVRRGGRGGVAWRRVSEKTKELIALALGVAAHCDGCLGFHVKALARRGHVHGRPIAHVRRRRACGIRGNRLARVTSSARTRLPKCA
jgi:AhpD family alkylhydroperoxidase